MIDVILPVLDEVEALPWVLSRMPPAMHPIVVDNGSTDGSGDVAASLGAEVVLEPRRGFGAACYAGLSAATAEVVCFMDCDGSLDPTDLFRVAQPVVEGAADLAVGERVPQPGAWPVHLRLTNRLLAAEVRRRTGLRLRDLGPMRAAHREPLVGLTIADRRSGWPLEMVLLAHRQRWRGGPRPPPHAPPPGRSHGARAPPGLPRA